MLDVRLPEMANLCSEWTANGFFPLQTSDFIAQNELAYPRQKARQLPVLYEKGFFVLSAILCTNWKVILTFVCLPSVANHVGKEGQE